MSFTKLKDRLDSLPLVLAGPIVRRLEPGEVTVWVALRRRRRIRLEIYDDNPPQGQIVANGATDTVAIGVNLHIACVTARPTNPFTAGTTYQYNLFFDHVGGADDIQSGINLFGPRIVSASNVAAVAEDEARHALTYAVEGGPTRPSFVMPPTALDDLRILHGSCRKVSGPHNDALEAADQILREVFTKGEKRSHMLFLTGDNIYNDGCERKLFEMILEAGPTLLGWDESLVVTDTGFFAKFSEFTGDRSAVSLVACGLSSPGADLRQLFGLGEILVLYLLTFAPPLWPDDLDYQRGTFDFRGTLPAVRRALANVVTYMIFDDHEFSNSWNLTANWVESVLRTSMGRRIYQNALAAYALCQGWGNTPAQFEAGGAGKALLDAIVAWSEAEIAGTRSPAAPLAEISRRAGLPDVDAFANVRDWSGFHGPEVVRWHYSVPCPSLNIDVLDTYMWRAYESEVANSIIVSDEGLNQQLSAPPPTSECSLIVVSNVGIDVPGGGGQINQIKWWLTKNLSGLLLPIWVLAQILALLVALFIAIFTTVPIEVMLVLGASSFALLRAWLYWEEYGSSYIHQTKAFESLISHVMHRAPQQLVNGKRKARAILISGDAHETFSMRMEYWSRIPFNVSGDPVEGVVLQLTGSPCKWVNPGEYKFKDPNDRLLHHWAGWRDEPQLTWINEPDESPFRFKKSPLMMKYVPGANQPLMNPEPEWRYSLAPVPQVPRPIEVPLEIPDRPNPTFEEQIKEMENVSPDAIWANRSSEVLKVNNLADVTFNWQAGSKTVVENVWWRGRPAIDRNWTKSRFDASMEPPSPPPLPQ